MSGENEPKKINREELSSEERSKLIAETSDVSEGKTPDFELTGGNKTETETFKHPFEFTYKKEGEEPAKEDETPGEGEGGEGGSEPTAYEKAQNDILSKIEEANPELKGKYKTLDEYIAATTGKSKEEHAPGGTNEPGKTGNEPAPVQILKPEEREQVILDKAYEFFSQDKTVQELLGKIGISKVPMTLDEWQEMHKQDQEKNGTNFISSQITSMFNRYKSNVETQLSNIEQTMGNRDKMFVDATSDFVTRIEKTVTDIFPKITAEQAKPVKDKMDAFYKEAVKFENNAPVHPEYFTIKNGIPIPNGKALAAGFIAEHATLIPDIARLAAAKEKPGLKKQLQNNSKNGGKSIKTLGNQGHNSGSAKKIFVDNPKDRQNLSSRERAAVIEALNEEIKNT